MNCSVLISENIEMLSSRNGVSKIWSNNTKGFDAAIKSNAGEENLYDTKVHF